ncbi:MAG: DNA-binding response regulator [Proteobacteria bacterium]|nr:MAG: DNA-binding response regulator [Pseudomonadota bacterium]
MKILLIEDDPTISQFVAKGLTQSGYRVDIASDGETGLDLALNDEYDLGIVDLMLPGVDGISIIERVRCEGRSLPIIILSARRTVDDRVTGLQRGGDDYLTKPFSFSELLARVQAQLRRASEQQTGTTLCVHDLEIDLLARTVTRAGRRVDLQPKEFMLLEYLVRHVGHVVSKTMIIERVWNYNFDPRTNIVEARISKLREKIDRDFDNPLIHTVRGVGYVLK